MDALLDTKKTRRKPQNAMALKMPLVLQSCEFEDARLDIYQLQPATFHEAVLSSLPLANGAETKFQPDYFYQSFSSVCLLIFIAENGFEFSDQSLLNEGMIKKVASYVPPLGAIIIVLQPIGPPEP
ncbi:hypothetical protein QQP08_023817 [Theobroma cacao]|nr:hypothetical protein QQP08_023817 [Theobroma cacao]